MEQQPQGIDWLGLIQGANDIFLQDYATVTGKPIAREQPSSVMGWITGTDYGRSGPTSTYSSPIGGGIIMLGVLGVIAVVLLTRK